MPGGGGAGRGPGQVKIRHADRHSEAGAAGHPAGNTLLSLVHALNTRLSLDRAPGLSAPRRTGSSTWSASVAGENQLLR